jgi:hypothetical protein
MENTNFQNNQYIDGGKNAKNFFLNLFSIVTLYLSSISFIGLSWRLIDYFLVDTLYLNYFSFSYFVRFVAYFISILLVSFVAFISVTWKLNKFYKEEPILKEARFRKWFIYLTLFVVSLVVLIDLIYIINRFISGEITNRFFLKSLIVFLVGGLVFWHYLEELKKQKNIFVYKIIFVLGTLLVFSLIGFSFFVIGFPNDIRLLMFDEKKINDLININNFVKDYVRINGVLPKSLSDLKSNYYYGGVSFVDPQTGLDYEYFIKDDKNLEFVICAVFNLEPKENNRVLDYNKEWLYSKGRSCFTRKVILEKDYPLKPDFNIKSTD